MTKRSISVVVVVVLQVLLFTTLCLGGGSRSENYALPTSVISSGGSFMGSGSFKAQGTIGQSSPLMDPDNPPYSEGNDLYPGFWYTLEAEMMCGDVATFAATFGHVLGEQEYSAACDLDTDGPDGDVDGSDLAAFANGL